MRPSSQFLLLLVAWIVIGIFNSFKPTGVPFWFITGSILLALGLLDALIGLLQKPLQFSRGIPSRWALGQPEMIDVELTNTGFLPIKGKVFDGVPTVGEAPELPWRGKIPANSAVEFQYQLRMVERGRWEISPAHVEWATPLGLWLRKKTIGETDELKVYPNYEPTIEYALLALANQQSQMGIRPRNLMGMSKEFLQLRDYQEGDVLSQIDWKATSRHQSIISREYQEQKDQSLILMLDTGRRMRAMDGELAHFDHCLNAVLLVSYLALQHDDQVAILGFGGSNRWLSPVKGKEAMPKVLEHLYDYETTIQPSDFSEAAERLLSLQRRRSMVVIVSNLRGEDEGDLLPAIEVLRERHLVIVTSLREKSIANTLEQPVEELEDALLYGATAEYLEERRQLIEAMRSRGVSVVDTDTGDLPIAISNAYLEARRST